MALILLSELAMPVHGATFSGSSAQPGIYGSKTGHLRAAAAAEANDDEDIRIGPNPFTPNNDGFNDFVIFDFSGTGNVASAYMIIIFDMNGRRIRTLQAGNGVAEVTWDGRDSNGNTLKPGVYLYIIERSRDVVRRGSITLAL
ncbi:MAG: gliding motility-associated C-terminal domain-containing protein [Cyclonatronaceae bacterium]